MKFSQFTKNSKLSFYSSIEERDRITVDALERTEEITYKTPSGKEVLFRKVKLGKWEKYQVVGLQNYHYCFCSVCGAEALQDEYGAVQSKFCPNCGADMRGEIE